MGASQEQLMKKLHVCDFTIEEYSKLLTLAKKNYTFIRYDEIRLFSNFILWRHDCDFSLNRALRLARIEHQQGIVATYFINFHSDFYNVLEKSQTKIINEIISLGHDIGLHFDTEYYDISSEVELEYKLAFEAQCIEKWFGIAIKVFSFHNPNNYTLTCVKETYSGLINCYSNYLKENASYCSDSNGYWRFRRLRDVLMQAKDKNLQVLTHPDWWQETAMFPRERVHRCIDGRAKNVKANYDTLLKMMGRTNI